MLPIIVAGYGSARAPAASCEAAGRGAVHEAATWPPVRQRTIEPLLCT